MTPREMIVKIAATITTLAEVKEAPESMFYLGLGMNFDDWQTIRSALLHAGLITIENYLVHLTPLGRLRAEQLNAVLRAEQAAEQN